MFGVNIGPMEAFQGLESRAVIVCTTRTRKRFLQQDQRRGLGLIGEPKRFNVALTRAMEGLIVIGNPELLKEDESWAPFLKFCWRNGLWNEENGKESVSNSGYGLFANDKDDGPISALEAALLKKEAMGGDEGEAEYARIIMSGRGADDEMWLNGMVEGLSLEDEHGDEDDEDDQDDESGSEHENGEDEHDAK